MRTHAVLSIRLVLAVLAVALGVSGATAQTSAAPPTVDITAAQIDAFIDALPSDAISDRPIRIADAGGYAEGGAATCTSVCRRRSPGSS